MAKCEISKNYEYLQQVNRVKKFMQIDAKVRLQ